VWCDHCSFVFITWFDRYCPVSAGGISSEKGSELGPPHGQYAYRRMGMGLKNAMHIYAQFTDMVFGPLPRAEDPDHREVDREEKGNVSHGEK
jgi:hypothetical protein